LAIIIMQTTQIARKPQRPERTAADSMDVVDATDMSFPSPFLVSFPTDFIGFTPIRRAVASIYNRAKSFFRMRGFWSQSSPASGNARIAVQQNSIEPIRPPNVR
jgi:hypothetical protein